MRNISVNGENGYNVGHCNPSGEFIRRAIFGCGYHATADGIECDFHIGICHGMEVAIVAEDIFEVHGSIHDIIIPECLVYKGILSQISKNK